MGNQSSTPSNNNNDGGTRVHSNGNSAQQAIRKILQSSNNALGLSRAELDERCRPSGWVGVVLIAYPFLKSGVSNSVNVLPVSEALYMTVPRSHVAYFWSNTKIQPICILSLGRKGYPSADWGWQTRGTSQRLRRCSRFDLSRMPHLFFQLFWNQCYEMLSCLDLHWMLSAGQTAETQLQKQTGKNTAPLSLLQRLSVECRCCGVRERRGSHRLIARTNKIPRPTKDTARPWK